jgi:hypothetical protein
MDSHRPVLNQDQTLFAALHKSLLMLWTAPPWIWAPPRPLRFEGAQDASDHDPSVGQDKPLMDRFRDKNR